MTQVMVTSPTTTVLVAGGGGPVWVGYGSGIDAYKIRGVPVSVVAPTAGQALVYSAGAWVPADIGTQIEVDALTAALAAHVANVANPHVVTKAQVGLSAVENVALSTWAGSANLTALGTIATGVWNATAIVWAKVDKTGSSLADLATRSAGDLTSGTLADARFPATLPAVSGANLTALNASNLASGTVPDARFPATLPVASGVNLTALNASNIASGNLAYARMPTGGGTWAMGGDTQTTGGEFTVSRTSANNASVNVSALAGFSSGVALQTGGLARWKFTKNTTAESGANAGSDLQLTAFDDAGANLNTPITIVRAATGAITLARPVTFTSAPVIMSALGTTTPLVIGHTAALVNIANANSTGGSVGGALTEMFTTTAASLALVRWNSSVNGGGGMVVGRAYSDVIGDVTLLAANARIFTLAVVAADGIDLGSIAGALRWTANGTPAANRIPTKLDVMLAAALADDDYASVATFAATGLTLASALTFDLSGALRATSTIRSGSATISAGSQMEANLATGTSTIVPVIIRARSSSNSGGWLTGAANFWGAFDFYSDDVSGLGAGARARLSAHMENAAGSPTGLALWVGPNAGLAVAVTLGSDLSATFAGAVSVATTLAVTAAQKLYLDGPLATGNTYIQESSADVLDLFAGGVNSLRLTTTLSTFGGAIRTSAPVTGTAASWKLGTIVTGQVGLVVISTQYVQLDIAGTLYKLATV